MADLLKIFVADVPRMDVDPGFSTSNGDDQQKLGGIERRWPVTEDLRKAFELLVEEIDLKAKEIEARGCSLIEERRLITAEWQVLRTREKEIENELRTREKQIESREAAVGQVRQLAANRKVEIETLKEKLQESEDHKRELNGLLREARHENQRLEKLCQKLLNEKHDTEKVVLG